MPFPELPVTIAAAIAEHGYEEPTPVQAAVLEPEALNRDMVVSAQTGSGKTVAFGLNMATQLLDDEGKMPFSHEPLALVIAPTRELALQVSRELTWLYAKTNARIMTCVGGMDPSKERRALSRGTNIVVGTPGRLRDHLERGALDLSALRFVVLDEADEMLDMGFRDDLEQILDGTPEERRTLLFSATMPKQIVGLARRYQNDALRISTRGDDRGHGDITYQAIAVSPADIEHAVINLLRFHDAETAILFCATRDNVRHLHASLVERGFAAVALSGEHSQNERNYALQALRDKRARVCVATDVASRGIDVVSLTLVIHVEMPRDAEVLQHRSGRTGRAGKKGTAVLIVPYPRRRRVEGMLRSAKISAEWVDVPTREAIEAQDRERMFEALLEPIEASDEELVVARKLLDGKSAEDVAVSLIRAHSSRLPTPEELIDISSKSRDSSPREQSRRREGFDDTVWFKMDIGRSQNADPRWILPLLCRRGHITRNEIGAIRINDSETYFQVPRAVEAKVRDALQRTSTPGTEDESGINIELAEAPPREAARQNRGKPHGYQGRGGNAPGRDDRGPRHEGRGPPRRDDRGPRSDGPRGDRPRRDDRGSRNDGPRSDKPSYGMPRNDGPRPNKSRPANKPRDFVKAEPTAKQKRGTLKPGPAGDRPTGDRPKPHGKPRGGRFGGKSFGKDKPKPRSW